MDTSTLLQHLKENDGMLCKSEMKEVLSVRVVDPAIGTIWPISLNQGCGPMIVATTQKWDVNVPVQIQFEIVPLKTRRDTYLCQIKSIKARIKPGTPQFIGAEEKNLDHILNGTEDTAEEKRRVEKQAQKNTEQAKKETEAANRFTGLEL